MYQIVYFLNVCIGRGLCTSHGFMPPLGMDLSVMDIDVNGLRNVLSRSTKHSAADYTAPYSRSGASLQPTPFHLATAELNRLSQRTAANLLLWPSIISVSPGLVAFFINSRTNSQETLARISSPDCAPTETPTRRIQRRVPAHLMNLASLLVKNMPFVPSSSGIWSTGIPSIRSETASRRTELAKLASESSSLRALFVSALRICLLCGPG
jgi:hypothetical protein